MIQYIKIKYLFSRKNRNEKKELDLSKPLTAGAFVDQSKIQELHRTLSEQLPPEPPMAWLLAEKEKMENVRRYFYVVAK